MRTQSGIAARGFLIATFAGYAVLCATLMSLVLR